MKEAKYARLFKEQEELISQRKKEITAIYKVCQRQLDPAFWQYLPEPNHSYKIDTISRYIYFPEQSAMTVPYDTAQMILLFFDQWLACGKRGLLEVMSKHHPLTLFQDDALDLATSVFICTLHPPNPTCYSVLLGWEDAAVHLECNLTQNHQQLTKNFPELFLFEYSMIGRKTALFLLGLLGLEASTPALDVEALEARFMCVSCPLEARRGRMKGRFALKFKECVRFLTFPDIPIFDRVYEIRFLMQSVDQIIPRILFCSSRRRLQKAFYSMKALLVLKANSLGAAGIAHRSLSHMSREIQ